ncbi:MAG: beta-glucosidase BglX [Saprospiraceae bacterium]
MNHSQLNQVDHKVEKLLSRMSLLEKIGQMNQYNGFWDVTGPPPKGGSTENKYTNLKLGLVGSMLNIQGVKNVRALQKIAVEKTNLGIPLIFGFDIIHGYKTISPIPIAESASWDMDAIKLSARIAAKEAAAAGINWTFAPMIDISRDARWGRVMEGGGEDTYLGSQVAIARVTGFQGDDLSKIDTIAACAKHFAAYGFGEAGKEYNTVSIDKYTLHNSILPPFKAAVNAGVKTFMNAFNEINGIPATGSKHLQREILKKEWNFQGFVVSDWDSIGEMIVHGFAKNKKDAAQLAVEAGSDMDMESHIYISQLEQLVKDGKVCESTIDDAVKRILKVKYELGLFDNPYLYCDAEREKSIVGCDDHQDIVLDMAKKSIVLLKNDKTKEGKKLLPLKKSGLNISIIGGLADDKDSPLGSWRIAADPETAVSFLEGMSAYKGNHITYSKGADVTLGKSLFVNELKLNTSDKSDFENAIIAAKKADVVVMVLGEHGFQTGEARSRTSLQLPGVQQELLEAVYEVNTNIVLVLNNGRPLAITWADKHIPAIVEAWHLGTQSGNAIAQVLYGDYNPSGKLPMTFPRNVGQVPIYYNHKNSGRPLPSVEEPNLVFWTHYSDVDNSPLYRFGYGLSYASFEYKNLRISKTKISINDTFQASIEITNTSEIAGEEVVQLYIRDLIGSITRPIKELKGFEKIYLKAFETKTVVFEINKNTLAFYTANDMWEVETGDFELWIGGCSDTTIKTSFEVI